MHFLKWGEIAEANRAKSKKRSAKIKRTTKSRNKNITTTTTKRKTSSRKRTEKLKRPMRIEEQEHKLSDYNEFKYRFDDGTVRSEIQFCHWLWSLHAHTHTPTQRCGGG